MSAQTGDQQQVSKGLLITLGVVAAIGVAAALWVFVLQPLMSDESEPVAGDDQVDAAEPDADAEADPGPDAEADEPGDPSGDAEGDGAEDDDDAAPAEDDPLDSTHVVNARDPFTQLVTDTSGGGGSGAATATGGGESTGGDTSGGGDGGEDQADVDSTTVTLVDIYTGDDDLQRASIEVNETGYDVLEGETFADNFQLLDIADDCATMLYGDSRFTLCEGDRVRK